ncbi:F-box/kelch-repeat protein At3g06240-like [Arachis hypogaea]|uniref:F-box/kelch-repeat protein At3g06240-like n=1 Tax=Arachis hypogaea TaxID=3818 RepID=UPI003B2280FC
MTKFQLPLPIIPDELLQEIFLRSSAKAIGRCMCLNKFWHRQLRQPETCIQHMRRQKMLDQHVLFHVGYSLLLMGSDSLYIVNAASGEEVHIQQPFGVGIYGWFRIVGVSNGNICFKFSREQDDTRLLVWNLTTQCSREIFDPHRDHGRSYFPVYGFGHVPNSDAYTIIHMCKRDIADAYVFFSRYCSRRSTWFHCVDCLPGVEKIDPNSVFNNGHAYWITGTGDSYATPKSVLCYSVEDESFSEVSIPVGAIYTVHNLLTHKEKVALLAHTHNEFGYVAAIWHLNKDAGGNRILEQYCRFASRSIRENPILFVDDNLLLLVNNSKERELLVNYRYRELVLTEYDIEHGTRNLLVRRAWRYPETSHPITVRSTLKYFAGMFPV